MGVLLPPKAPSFSGCAAMLNGSGLSGRTLNSFLFREGCASMWGQALRWRRSLVAKEGWGMPARKGALRRVIDARRLLCVLCAVTEE